MNLASFLAASAAARGEAPAITDVSSGVSLTYLEVAREAERVATFLADQGLERGQRVALFAPNAVAYLPATFGLLSAGACVVPLAHNLVRAEIDRIVADVDVNACLHWPGGADVEGHERGTILSEGACEGFSFHWTRRTAAGPSGFESLNPAFVRFTSGTTAERKGVVLSHEAIAARVVAADGVLGLGGLDRVLWVLPLAYHFAVTIVAYVRAGAHVLLCPDSSPRRMVDAVRRNRATILYAAPLHFQRLSGLAAADPLSSVRLAVSTSAPISPAVVDRFESIHGVPLGQAYGLIEAGLPCINPGNRSVPKTSVGRPVPGYEIAVLSEAGERVEIGAAGEVAVRGPGMFSAYYAPWTPFDRIARDGWFPTGDIGLLDPTGALHLKGRKKAVIMVAGLKFFPEEVEECLDRASGVKESRVYGRPHPHLGEVPCAEVVLESPGRTVDDLLAHCARRLSPYKVPVEIRVVTSLPRTPGGKLLRRPVVTASEPGAATR